MKHRSGIAATTAVLSLAASSAFAAAIPPASYYTDVIGGGIGSALTMTGGGHAWQGEHNDDGFSGPIDLGFTLNYFGNNYSQFFANNNGNISFGSGVFSYMPDPLNTSLSAPMIAPYWADVDTRDAASGLMYLRKDISNQVIVTWHQVGYFDSHADNLASFQLVLRGPGYSIPSDEGQIGFFFKTMGWEVGDASGGAGGFDKPDDGYDAPEATVGFGDGKTAANPGEISLPGSQQAGISNVVANNHYWFNLGQGGVPTVTQAVPEPASAALFALGLGGLAFGRRRRIV